MQRIATVYNQNWGMGYPVGLPGLEAVLPVPGWVSAVRLGTDSDFGF
jgi:hypothetical protein